MLMGLTCLLGLKIDKKKKKVFIYLLVYYPQNFKYFETNIDDRLRAVIKTNGNIIDLL